MLRCDCRAIGGSWQDRAVQQDAERHLRGTRRLWLTANLLEDVYTDPIVANLPTLDLTMPFS
eukprot:10696343-Lingulodinium_polyedra.AAC.1